MERSRPTLKTVVPEIFTLAQKAELYITSYSTVKPLASVFLQESIKLYGPYKLPTLYWMHHSQFLVMTHNIPE